MCANFQLKRTTLTSVAQICPKRKLGFEIQKTNVGIRISILEIRCGPISRQNGQLSIFGPNFYPKMDFGVEISKILVLIRNQHPWDAVCTNFQRKWATLNICTQICSKMDFEVEISKIRNSGSEISILDVLCVPIFRQNGQHWIFGSKFAQKWILGLGFQKSKSEFGISTSNIPCVPIFSQNGQLLIFRSKFGEIAQLRAIFWFKYCWRCWRELGGGWNELTGGGWGWMVVGARFSNTLIKLNMAVLYILIKFVVLYFYYYFAFLFPGIS